MTSPGTYTPPETLFDPTPYGAGVVYTPLPDFRNEVEWWRTQHALGRPVDLNALFALLDRDDEESDGEEELDEAQRATDSLCEAVDKADEEINAVRATIAEEVLGKLNRINRHDVARILKEQFKRLDEIQMAMLDAKPEGSE